MVRPGKRLVVLVSLLMSLVTSALVPALAADSDYPLRAKYALVGVKSISTEDLKANLSKYTIIDARSGFEFKLFHIQGAYNIPVAETNRVLKIKELAGQTKKPLVFYCNGPLCEKSYKAAVFALHAGIKSPLVYDAGILSWAEVNPQETDLLGKPMESTNQLISEAEFKAHLLSPQRFYDQVLADPRAIVIDIRTATERAGISLIQMRDMHVEMDDPHFIQWIDTAKKENRAIYFFDANGYTVQFLQYYLKNEGITNYWFMKGGANTFMRTM